ncbi:HAD family hydrolase [Natronoglycomyces albus]|uniref:HAD family phosphatase n=1 Tax=Natronoglycomyces albus TaxID=2811108 RepID=A0A895XX02_9ACTN|nr:HAD family phosphatase [Natronoglycomyces albus]QSB06750.1 HAD family phosphatase [Natronoglycomyces albus]
MNFTLLDWSPSAVVFDCDGLLMDTEPCWTVAETQMFARRGLPFGPEQKAKVIGKSVAAASEAMAVMFNEPNSGPALIEEQLELVTDVIATQAEAMPGAHELVKLIADKVPVAVASNSPRSLLEVTLRRGGFAQVFPVVIAADEVGNPKPAPDMYARACELLGFSPEDSLAFEDSMTGARAARAAGMKLVAVPTLEHFDFPAELVVTSLQSPQLRNWIGAW